MKKILTLACAVSVLALASCASTSELGVEVAGHPYRTDPACKRTQPIGTFDRECDYPVVGIRGWSPDASIGISAGGNASGPTM